MGLLDDYSGTSGLAGLGMSPRPARMHQVIVSTMVVKFNLILYKHGYWALSEDAIWKELSKDKAPDVIIYKVDKNLEKWQPLMFIEIEKTKSIKRNINKAIDIMGKLPQIQQSFIYDYEQKTFMRLPDQVPSSICTLFNSIPEIPSPLNLSEFVKPMFKIL